MEQRIVVSVRSAAERTAVLLGVGDLHVEFCSDLRRAAVASMDAGVVAIVADLDAASEVDFRAVIEVARRRARPVPVLVRFGINSASIGQILRGTTAAIDLRLSLRGFDDLSVDTTSLISPTAEVSARWAIASRVADRATANTVDIAFASAIVGERRCSVQELAAYCRLSVRRIEERLVAAGLLPAKRLLMRILVLHAHWRHVVLGWSPKRIAIDAGFASPEALAQHFERATGVTILGLSRRGSFGDELDRLAIEMSRPSLTLLSRDGSSEFASPNDNRLGTTLKT